MLGSSRLVVQSGGTDTVTGKPLSPFCLRNTTPGSLSPVNSVARPEEAEASPPAAASPVGLALAPVEPFLPPFFDFAPLFSPLSDSSLSPPNILEGSQPAPAHPTARQAISIHRPNDMASSLTYTRATAACVRRKRPAYPNKRCMLLPISAGVGATVMPAARSAACLAAAV